MLRTGVTDLLGIEHPILQAPMASAATPALAAAVSNAGALGARLGHAAGRRAAAPGGGGARADRPALPAQLFCHARPEIGAETASAARERFAALYGELGLGEPPEPRVPSIAFDAARLEALLELRPPVVSFHFGLPEPDALAAIREAGILVLASATTVAEGFRLEELGVDAVVAQVADAVGVPVIAAGGIADGRGLAAVLALGAGAAQVGTAFLPCPESGISPAYREGLRRARAEDSAITRTFTRRPARALCNRVTEELEAVLPYPAQMSLTGPLRELAPDGDPGAFQAIWAGSRLDVARPPRHLGRDQLRARADEPERATEKRRGSGSGSPCRGPGSARRGRG